MAKRPVPDLTVSRKHPLSEELLGIFLRERLDPEIVQNKRLPGSEYLFRYDFRSEVHKILVEFDGPVHFRQTAADFRDFEKNLEAEKYGYTMIRIPYFLQLDETTIPVLFGDAISDTSGFLDFPHGFISVDTILPSDFNELGVHRFTAALEHFPGARMAILDSLKKIADDRFDGVWDMVFPLSMYDQAATIGLEVDPRYFEMA